MNNINTLKEEIKLAAKEIRKEKSELKAQQRKDNSTYPSGDMMYSLMNSRDTLRHMHVAYSLARGNEYKDIEPKVREGNEISWSEIEKIQTKYGLLEKEVV